ncbi:hypothetical protein MB02_16330 [Croceicoccus estronivorus]|nr:hypothetical protein MB02_16330 [Croceicoccus estronivorus]
MSGIIAVSFASSALAIDPPSHDATHSGEAHGVMSGSADNADESGPADVAPTNHNTTRSNKASGITKGNGADNVSDSEETTSTSEGM